MRTGILILMIALMFCLVVSCDQTKQPETEESFHQADVIPEPVKAEIKPVCVMRSFSFSVASGD